MRIQLNLVVELLLHGLVAQRQLGCAAHYVSDRVHVDNPVRLLVLSELLHELLCGDKGGQLADAASHIRLRTLQDNMRKYVHYVMGWVHQKAAVLDDDRLNREHSPESASFERNNARLIRCCSLRVQNNGWILSSHDLLLPFSNDGKLFL